MISRRIFSPAASPPGESAGTDNGSARRATWWRVRLRAALRRAGPPASTARSAFCPSVPRQLAAARAAFRSRRHSDSAYFTSVGATRTSFSNCSSAFVRQLRRDLANLARPDSSQRFLIHVVGGRQRRLFSNSPSRRISSCGMRQQVRDLRFQRARIDDFAQRSIGRQRQQITRDVEGPRAQGALVGIGFMSSGLGVMLGQVFETCAAREPRRPRTARPSCCDTKSAPARLRRNRECSSRSS